MYTFQMNLLIILHSFVDITKYVTVIKQSFHLNSLEPFRLIVLLSFQPVVHVHMYMYYLGK